MQNKAKMYVHRKGRGRSDCDKWTQFHHKLLEYSHLNKQEETV